MATKLPSKPTPEVFAATWKNEVLKPAVEQLAGADGRLSRTEAETAATALTATPARHAADNIADVFAETGVKTSTAVTTALKAGEKLALDAAKAIAGPDGVLSPSEMNALVTFKADFDYLRSTTVRVEIGVVSDLDSTVIPPERNGVAPPAYPGVAQLYTELELGNRGKPGDVRYVTARSPERVVDVPAYLQANELPPGPIDTGTSQLPWVAQPEKVRDITRIFEANPTQKFVLFGDTDARDPEVYREIATNFPNQIAAIVIQKVNRTVPDARVEGMHLIENYAEAAARLLNDGVLTKTAARRVMKAAQTEGLAITNAEIDALIAANS